MQIHKNLDILPLPVHGYFHTSKKLNELLLAILNLICNWYEDLANLEAEGQSFTQEKTLIFSK